ncbi:MAG: tetratricopeptide repeat protein [Acidobacteriota bacterium]
MNKSLANLLIFGALLVVGCGTSRDLALLRVENALAEGRADRARVHVAEYLERHPNDAEAWRLGGEAWMSGNLRSPSRAVEHWQQYLTFEPDDQELTTRVAEALFVLGDFEDAATWVARAGEGARADLLRVRLALDADPERAREALERVMEAEADGMDRREVDALAARLYAQLDQADRALDHARQAIEADPFDLQSTYLAARLERRGGNLETATELLETHQMLSRLVGAGSTAALIGAEAVEQIRELAQRVNADAVAFRLTLVRNLAELGERGEAEELLTGLVEDSELTAAQRLELAGIADRLDHFDLAGAFLDSVFMDASTTQGNQSEALVGLAVLAHREGEQAAYRDRVDQGLVRFPTSARFHHLDGRIRLADGERDAASRSLQRALELAPWNVDCRLDLANVYLADGRLDEVEALIDAAPEESAEIDAYRRRHGF